MNFLIIGDPIIDSYSIGDIRRISPEAPIPVSNYCKSEHIPGGALNVASNLIALGLDVSEYYPIGTNEEEFVRQICLSRPSLSFELLPNYNIPQKIRFTDRSYHQLLRLDKEVFLSDDWHTNRLDSLISKSDIILLSDYDKGAINNSIISKIKDSAKPFFVDTKKCDISIFAGAKIIKPNLQEARKIVSNYFDVNGCESIHSLVPYFQKLCVNFSIESFIVTLGADGSCFISSSESFIQPAINTDLVADVTGAGDTFFAAIAYATYKNFRPSKILQFANFCASDVIRHSKTSVLSSDIFNNFNHSSSIGFTNGCFDILHCGHLSSLYKASTMCSKLIVGINTDNSIRRLKGPSRPILNLQHRIAALELCPLLIKLSLLMKTPQLNL